MRREVFLVAGSVLFALLLLEGLVRVYYGVRERVPPHPDPSVRDEWSWAREHLRAGRAEGPGLAGYDAELGWIGGAGDVDGWLRRKGFQVPAGDPEPRTERPRYLFVGDSFTEGLYVADHETFAFRFGADFHPDAEVLNLGVAGYGPDQMLLLYERIGRRYRPDVVVLGFYVRGLYRALARFTYYAKPWFEAQSEGIALRGVPVAAPQALLADYVTGARRVAGFPYSYLWGAAGASVERLTAERRFADGDDPRWTVMRRLLARFAGAVDADGGRAVLLIVPSRLEEFADSIHEDLDRIASLDACRYGILPVSLAPALAAAESATAAPTFRPRAAGGHFSARGHAVAAAAVAAALDAPSPCSAP